MRLRSAVLLLLVCADLEQGTGEPRVVAEEGERGGGEPIDSVDSLGLAMVIVCVVAL